MPARTRAVVARRCGRGRARSQQVGEDLAVARTGVARAVLLRPLHVAATELVEPETVMMPQAHDLHAVLVPQLALELHVRI